MTRLERCELAIKKGYTYDPETGLIYNRYGKIIKRKVNNYIKLCLFKNDICCDIYGHQFAWYWVKKECVNQIDHINGVRDDNRIINLRSVNQQQNNWNRTKAKGYHWYKRDNKWMSKIKINYKTIYLGLFNTEEEARQAYLNAKQIYHVI